MMNASCPTCGSPLFTEDPESLNGDGLGDRLAEAFHGRDSAREQLTRDLDRHLNGEGDGRNR
ncbi:MAG: hypothetical protein U5K29_00770 [Acidimicrobiales bacterium]|nr:hypothetical protein [Acidimicrobiales bacterium]